MKAVAYGVLAIEKEYFAKANNKKHDITLIANQLAMDTVHYAEGKEAIIMPEYFMLTIDLRNKLGKMGVKYIFPRPTSDNLAALPAIAEQIITNLDRANETNWLFPAS
ncbi:MAG: hypothetical protein C0191_04020 [Mucilaginibacter sp.]|nr:MAG: hypothetical protein C0191_04020 [Mucilaginibacter sp.]HEK21409.1 hypothetical protein [Bacteroidota bacterium]